MKLERSDDDEDQPISSHRCAKGLAQLGCRFVVTEKGIGLQGQSG
jgi:hypothetical protein